MSGLKKKVLVLCRPTLPGVDYDSGQALRIPADPGHLELPLGAGRGGSPAAGSGAEPTGAPGNLTASLPLFFGLPRKPGSWEGFQSK